MTAGVSQAWRVPGRVETLSRLWKEGKSASEIARTLNCGLTRNAIIGKIHRMGLSNGGRDTDMTKVRAAVERAKQTALLRERKQAEKLAREQFKDAAKEERERRQRAETETRRQTDAAVELSAITSPHARPWMERRAGECNWPLGERGAIRACCNPIARGGWCAGHSAVGHDLTEAKYRSGLRKGTAASLERAAVWMTRHDRLDRVRPTGEPTRLPLTASLWDGARDAA